MQRLICLLMISCTMQLNGQHTLQTKPVEAYKRFSMGVNFSSDYCFRTLKNNGSSSTTSVVASRNNIEIAKFGYTTGLNVYYSLSKHIELETGLQYSNKGYRTKKQQLVFGTPDPAAPVNAVIAYNYHYLDIPLKVNFVAGNGRTRFLSGIGLTTNFLLKETQKMMLEYAGGKKETKSSSTTDNYHTINLSPAFSIGMDYAINNHSNIRVEPAFSYGIIKTVDAPVAEYLWSGSLNISYRFEL